MSDTGGFPLVGGNAQFPGKNNVTRDGSGSNSFGWDNLNVGNASFAGGYRNKSSSVLSFAYGLSNVASGFYSIALGELNTASGSRSVALGGIGTASAAWAFTVGNANTSSGNYAIAIGDSNSSSGSASFAIGGNCTASSTRCGAFGSYAFSARTGEISHASGRISANGDAQHGWLVFRNQSTSATPILLYLDGSSLNATLAAGARWKCTAEIIATTTGAINKSASWEYKFQIDRPTNAASTIIRTTPLLSLSDGSNAGAPPAGWAVAITADTTNGCPQIQVTGDTDTINWTCCIHYIQSIRV